jgi:thiol-disulfide isomerase/thioredoxin
MHRITLAKRAALVLLCTWLMACSPAPEFHYADGSGGRLDDYRGKYLLVNYWAEWCKPCLKEIPELNEFAHQYADKAAIVAVNWDGIQGEELRLQAEKLNIEFDVVVEDISGLLGQKKPTVLPTTFIIDPEGQLINTLIGPQYLDTLVEAVGF